MSHPLQVTAANTAAASRSSLWTRRAAATDDANIHDEDEDEDESGSRPQIVINLRLRPRDTT